MTSFIIFLVILITYPFPSYSRLLKITFIDVGQGDSILVEFPGCDKMLIDGGGIPYGHFDIGENVVSPFLWSKGIKKIKYLVLTHAHPDHLNGLKAVVRNFGIGEYWEAFSPMKNESYEEFKNSLSSRTIKKRLFRNHFFKENKVKIQVLHPAKSDPFVKSIDNDQSLVLRMTYGKTSFLLTGDIEKGAEYEIIQNNLEIESLLLKSPHHGSASSNSHEFLHEVNPCCVVISVGEGNRYGFPDKEVLDTYEKIGLKVFRTDNHGAIEVTSDGQELFINTAVRKNGDRKHLFPLKADYD